VPAILDIDDATGERKVAMADSFDIAKYLDEAYPDTPKLFPGGDKDKTMEKFVKEAPRMWIPLYIIAFKATYPKLNPASQPHFTIARAKDLQGLYPGKERLEDIPLSPEERAESWKKVEACFDLLEEKVKGTDEKGQWYLGNEISFADMVVGGLLIWLRTIFGEDSQEWKDIQRWNEGRWEKFLEGLKGYQKVD
jgi:glutathione S-transferase